MKWCGDRRVSRGLNNIKAKKKNNMQGTQKPDPPKSGKRVFRGKGGEADIRSWQTGPTKRTNEVREKSKELRGRLHNTQWACPHRQ